MFTKSTLKIPSFHAGWDLDVWQYLPTAETSKPLPVIVMAHGFGANKTMGLSHYAEAFSAAGYACLVFDYRRWGASDGTPRQVLVVNEQLEDYRTVIKYARQQAHFDPQRLVVWGSSFSGGHSITLSSEANLNPVAAIAQCPYTGLTAANSPLWYLKIAAYSAVDLLKQALNLSPVYIPIISEPGTLGALTSEGTVPGMMAIVASESPYQNEISASSLLQVPGYQPMKNAKQVTCPLLIVLPSEDNLCLPEGAHHIAKTTTKCELVSVSGAGHFDVYHGQPYHAESLSAQLEFLKKHVPV
ncbi:alpha/beta-hydrolase [Roridomyces roridus]|uniref:Alpha/beta-hydrolase n=1 Tax=Roridomyces roridus TaxID=1738132 RepID=A0AAD7CKM8_9AGAR|nr:alpha/beta-hydrolase [Roridomyces roridus]